MIFELKLLPSYDGLIALKSANQGLIRGLKVYLPFSLYCSVPNFRLTGPAVVQLAANNDLESVHDQSIIKRFHLLKIITKLV